MRRTQPPGRRSVAPKRSIRTLYNGIEFRSKLEADWARTFDALGVAWDYEKLGAYHGDVFYLPDFWLPKSRQHFEVKAVFEPDDCRKICAYLHHAKPRRFTHDESPDIPIVCGLPGGGFFGWTRQPVREYGFEFLSRNAINVTLFQCTECLGWWFADDLMSWKCQCCGAYDGDHYLLDRISSPLPGWPRSPIAASSPPNEAGPF